MDCCGPRSRILRPDQVAAHVSQASSRGMFSTLVFVPAIGAHPTAISAPGDVLTELARGDLANGCDLVLEPSAVSATQEVAGECGSSLTLAPVSHDRTSALMESHRVLVAENPSLGITVRADLRRSEGDCVELAARGARVRLIRRMSAEPADVAFPSQHDVDRSFIRCLRALLDGADVAVVTESPRLNEIAAALGVGPDDTSKLTFQFRFDRRLTTAREFVAAGARVSTLLPFGPGWPYSSQARK